MWDFTELHVRSHCYAGFMSTVLSHSSALDVWARAAASGADAATIPHVLRVPRFDAAAVLRIPQPDRPYSCAHILVPEAEARRRAPGVAFHVWSRPLPPCSLAQIDDDVFVSTPEFLFLQAAFRLPFVRLLEFGYELCALYTLRLPGGKLTELVHPMTSAREIELYLSACAGAPGIRNARTAAAWILDRSRSPRESKFAISMTLPRMRGGQAVRGVELNACVPLADYEQKVAGKQYFEIDMYSERGKVAFEYYGKDAHEGRIRETRDIRRESILASKGISVHGVTKSQAENAMELERLAKLLKDVRGERWHNPTPEQEAKMRWLLYELYGKPDTAGQYGF